MDLEQWKKSTLKNYRDKFHPTDSEVKHVLDYLTLSEEEIRLTRLSYPDALVKADKWVEKMNSKANILDRGQTQEILSFSDGFKIVHLIDEVAKDWEGKQMGHCVGSYTGHQGIYSLRDSQDNPHATIELYDWSVEQISGKFNQPVDMKYIDHITDFIKDLRLYIASEALNNLNVMAIKPETKFFLNEHTTGSKFIENRLSTYINLNSKISFTSSFDDSAPEELYFLLTKQEDLENLKKLPENRFYEPDVFNKCFYYACERNNQTIVSFILKFLPTYNKNIRTKVLLHSVHSKNIEIIELVLKAGVDPNINNGNIFIHSATSGKTEVFKLLLRYGGDISKITEYDFNAIYKRNYNEILGIIIGIDKQKRFSIPLKIISIDPKHYKENAINRTKRICKKILGCD